MNQPASVPRRKRVMRIVSIVVVCAAAAWFMFCPFKPAVLVTPGDIAGRINQVGASRTIGEIFDTPTWTVMIDRIGKGRPEWLRIVPDLQPGLDADAAEEMRDHLGLAVPLNAEGVLSVTDPRNGPVTGVDSVCSVAFGNNLDTPLPRDFVTRAVRSVQTIHAAEFAPARDRCLAVLRRGVCTVCPP